MVDSGPQPLRLFSATPRRITVPYRADPAAAADRADLWLPADAASNHALGAMVLVLGVNNVGRRYPAVEHFADAMARSGVAVLVPDSAVLLAGGLERGEVRGIIDAFELLSTRPEVDPRRVGLVGLSVGGSLALLAAADPRVAERIRWVNAFGAYADAGEYLADVAAHAFTLDGRTIPWQPAQLARSVFVRLVLGLVPDAADRELLRAAYERVIVDGGRPAADARLLAALRSDPARAVFALLTAGSLARAREVVAGLPLDARQLLDGLSPVRDLSGIRSHVFLMHDTGDAYVPYAQSRELAAQLASLHRLQRATEFRLFDHVQPEGIDVVGGAPDLWRLLWHVQAVLMETL